MALHVARELLVLIDYVSLPLFCQQSPNLPDPSGPLSKVVWSSSIEAANTKVSALLSHQELEKKTSKGPYARFSAEKKAEVGRRAAEHGVASTVRFYAADSLKKTTVHTS